MKSMYKHIFEPLTIRRMTMKNRIMMTPMGTNYGEQSGEMSFLHINYYEQRARGGTGLIMVENANVDYPLGSNGTTQLRIDHDNYLPRLFKLTETVHKHGACIGIQINHAGASASLPVPRCSRSLPLTFLPKPEVKISAPVRERRNSSDCKKIRTSGKTGSGCRI